MHRTSIDFRTEDVKPFQKYQLSLPSKLTPKRKRKKKETNNPYHFVTRIDPFNVNIETSNSYMECQLWNSVCNLSITSINKYTYMYIVFVLCKRLLFKYTCLNTPLIIMRSLNPKKKHVCLISRNKVTYSSIQNNNNASNNWRMKWSHKKKYYKAYI